MPSPSFRRSVARWTLLVSGLSCAAVHAADARDPVRDDPSPELRPPAAIEVVAIKSAGAPLNGLIYLAAGAGPHAVAVFLHGYPGNEKNLDLAQAVRRAGFDVVFVDYRGNWGSGGTFSFAHGLEDVAAVLAWVRAPETVAKYHFDRARIALVGHSFGGWLALIAAGREPANLCVAALAAWNVGWAAQRFAAHEDERAASLADFRQTADLAGGPIHASAEDLQREITDHAEAWNYLAQASALGSRPLLLVAASRDTPDEDLAMHQKLANAIRAAGGKTVRSESFDDDHSFSSHRLALADLLTQWLQTDCARAQSSP